MSAGNELRDIMKQKGRMVKWADRVGRPEMASLVTQEDKEISSVMDGWLAEIGKTGKDVNNELASYILNQVAPEFYNAPDELLDLMFTRGTIGEFDYKENVITPKNTYIAHEALIGGNVDKSYVNPTVATKIDGSAQVETEIKWSDLRRGYIEIATQTNFMMDTMRNKMFKDIFANIDALIVGGDQALTASGSLSQGVMDELAVYLMDRGVSPLAITTNKYAMAIGRMTNHAQYMSNEEKNRYNMFGLVDVYQAMKIRALSGALKTGNGELIFPANKVYGIADKIGTLDMKGAVRVYEEQDMNNEVTRIKVTGFNYTYSVTDIEKIAKITIS